MGFKTAKIQKNCLWTKAPCVRDTYCEIILFVDTKCHCLMDMFVDTWILFQIKHNYSMKSIIHWDLKFDYYHAHGIHEPNCPTKKQINDFIVV